MYRSAKYSYVSILSCVLPALILYRLASSSCCEFVRKISEIQRINSEKYVQPVQGPTGD